MASSREAKPISLRGTGEAATLPRFSIHGLLGPRARRRLTPYVFLAPGFIVFATFTLYPLLKALQISFYHWQLVPGRVSQFIGLANYAAVLHDPITWVALRNTILYAVGTVPTQMALGLIVAILLDSVERLRVFFRTLYYLPVITSWVVVSILFKYVFSSDAGLANYLLHDVLHLLPAYVGWLQNVPTALLAIGVLGVWKGVGWSMLIFLAALQSIPKELRDAAAIDGAGTIRSYRSVIVPLMAPVMLFVLVLLVIGSFNVFISVYLMTGGGPIHQTEVLLTYMYHQAFDFLDFGYGSALSYLLAALIFALSLAQIRFLRREVEY
jgi:multiple sugar transport system permease protein